MKRRLSREPVRSCYISLTCRYHLGEFVGLYLNHVGEREALEETGLSVKSSRVIGLWESVFPTTADECIKRKG